MAIDGESDSSFLRTWYPVTTTTTAQYLLTNPESYGTNPYSLLQLLNLKGPFGKQE